MFENLIESSSDRGGQNKTTLLISFVVHTVIIATLLLIPLIYYDVLPESELLTFLALLKTK